MEITCKTFDNTLSTETLWKIVIVKMHKKQYHKGKSREWSFSSTILENKKSNDTIIKAAIEYKILKIIETNRYIIFILKTVFEVISFNVFTHCEEAYLLN